MRKFCDQNKAKILRKNMQKCATKQRNHLMKSYGFHNIFTSFLLYLFLEKNAKFREKVCKM